MSDKYRKNRICHCCGKGYNYCPNCYKDNDKDPSIYIMFDSKKCKDIFDTLVDSTLENITMSDAKSRLLEIVDINDIDKYAKVKDHLSRVLSYDDKKEDIIEEKVPEVTVDTLEYEYKESNSSTENLSSRKYKNNKKKNIVSTNSEVIDD